ncbi:MAG: hypothetical protein ACREC9_05855 [Methylocella sp.]
MRHGVVFVVGFLLVACSPFRAWADEPACVVRVKGEPIRDVQSFYAAPGGLLLGALQGLFRYDGARLDRVEGEPTESVFKFHYTPGGLSVGAWHGLFRYNGVRVDRVEGEWTERVFAFHDTPSGLPVGASRGLFRYDGARLDRVAGETTGAVFNFHDAPGELMVGAERGLFRYDGARVDRVAGKIGEVYDFHDTPGGLLVGARGGLFRYDGARLDRVAGETISVSWSRRFHDASGGLLVGAYKGLFRYDGARLDRVEGETTGEVNDFYDAPGGLLVGADRGLFRYDGKHVVRVEGEPIDRVDDFHDTPGGLLVGTNNVLFRYDGARVVHLEGEPTGEVYDFHDTQGRLLLGASKGLFWAILQPLATSKIVLDNVSQLKGAAPGQVDISTRWTMTHPCSAFAEKFNLQIVATNAKGEDFAKKPAIGFRFHDNAMSFEAAMPVTDAGNWTFRVVSLATGTETTIGAPSEPIPFVTPGPRGAREWLATWGKVIAAYSGTLWAMLNLAVFVAAGYSAAAWRLATDELWGKKALFMQSLLLRHWRGAQLWLLDLYVRERRTAAASKSLPYLPLPLTGPDGKFADSDSVLARLAAERHLWVQGGAGMGKTAMFLHLRQTHFAGTENTARAIFRRDGYVLVPIEARRFPEAPFDEKGGSAWVVACVLSVLSEGGLSFEDRGLLRAMLRKGALAIAIDGLNEVARGQAVSAFAAEFPAAPLFVTSQEPGESPFEVWHLPGTIAEHVNGLLALYLGPHRGEALARRLRDSGLIQHLRSGYDVRLVIELAEADPEGANLPHDRLGLYRAAVAAAWPEGDQRLDKLQAAAWKLISERGPNEDKRRLKPDEDAPKDLLEQLEAVREQSGRSIRLIRGAPPGYEFVHDQMNAYLAACWLVDLPTGAIMREKLGETKAWQDGLEAQRTLWCFVAAMLDQSRLEALWIFAGDDDRRAVLGRALAERAEREGWPLTRPPLKAPAAAE